MNVRDFYRAEAMAANASTKTGGTHIAGFLPTVAGTLTVTDADGTVLVNAVPVTAGVYVKIPLQFRTSAGGTIALAGGAAGTLFV